jgi:hypothetical protein
MIWVDHTPEHIAYMPMETISQRSIHRSGIEEYTKILCFGVGRFMKTSPKIEILIFQRWYDDRECFFASFESSEVFEKLEVYLVQPYRRSPVFIAYESDTIETVLSICCSLSKSIGTRCHIGTPRETLVFYGSHHISSHDGVGEEFCQMRALGCGDNLDGFIIFLEVQSLEKGNHIRISSLFFISTDRCYDIIRLYR